MKSMFAADALAYVATLGLCLVTSRSTKARTISQLQGTVWQLKMENIELEKQLAAAAVVAENESIAAAHKAACAEKGLDHTDPFSLLYV